MILVPACDAAGPGSGPTCGPTSAVVERVIDGDTVELAGGERVRMLLIDTPEITGGKDECYGEEAAAFHTDIVLDREVDLAYDEECRDNYGRLLAYLFVDDRHVNELMVERGYACVLHIPPNGDDLAGDFFDVEDAAREARRGMWGACQEVPCAN